MDEFVKLLLNHPDKFRKVGIWLSRLFLTILAASWLYTKIFGGYRLIQLNDLNQWGEFFLSGRVLVCCVLFIITNYVLFELLGGFSHWMYSSFAKWILSGVRKSKEIFVPIIWALRSGELLDINLKDQTAKLMDGTNELYQKLIQLEKKEGKAKLKNSRNQYIDEVGHTVFVFVVMYYTILNGFPHYFFFTFLVWLLLVAVFFAYAGLHIFSLLVEKMGPELIRMIDFARIEESAKMVFMEADLYVHDRKLANEKTYTCFYYNGRHIILEFCYLLKRLHGFTVKDLLKEATELNTLVVIISNGILAPETGEIIENNKQHLLYYHLTSEADTTPIIQQIIATHFSGPVTVL